MSLDANIGSPSDEGETTQALALMAGALVLAGWSGHGGSNTVVAIISFSILLMILIASALFVFEARLDESKRGAISVFCLPAVALLGISEALFLASGFFVAALTGLVLAFAFSAYRRLLMHGADGFLPLALRDLGIVGGVGVAGAGMVMVASKVLVG